MKELNILVIGLGSMGKRRIRNLIHIGIKNITGFDLRADRRDEASKLYRINIVESFQPAIKFQYDAWIISTPPDMHHIYMKEAITRKIPAFIEASVVDTDFELIIQQAKLGNVLLAPSCTLFFHPAVVEINNMINAKRIGAITNILYHSGQYLPDWHTYEKVSDYYVSNKATGGAREIVPFELTWLTKLFGFPDRITGLLKKTINIKGADDIDDTYNLLMDYPGYIMNLSVDVVSRYYSRRLLINGESGQILWNWEDNLIKIYSINSNQWTDIPYKTLPAQEGYNRNITEEMYIDELKSFLNAAFAGGSFPNSLEDDYKVLKLLYKAEQSCKINKIQFVNN